MSADLVHVEMDMRTYKMVTNLLDQREKQRVYARNTSRKTHNFQRVNNINLNDVYFKPVATFKYDYEESCYKPIDLIF